MNAQVTIETQIENTEGLQQVAPATLSDAELAMIGGGVGLGCFE